MFFFFFFLIPWFLTVESAHLSKQFLPPDFTSSLWQIVLHQSAQVGALALSVSSILEQVGIAIGVCFGKDKWQSSEVKRALAGWEMWIRLVGCFLADVWL